MRSRYAAYALGHIDYIIETTHSDGPHFQEDKFTWRAEIAQFCEQTRFVGLQVLGSGALQGEDAWVSFLAQLTQHGHDASFKECSTFRREDGRWCYLSGTPETPA